MQEAGVPKNDPEFMKLSQILTNFQKMSAFKKQQQMQLQQQQMQNAANGTINGAAVARPAQHPGTQTSQPTATTSLGASAMPAAASPSTDSAPTGPPAANATFTQDQLNLLRAQMHAFRSLTRNTGVPAQFQEAIFKHRHRRYAVSAERIAQAAAQSARASPSAAASAATDTAGPPLKIKEYKTMKTPYESGVVWKNIPYYQHAQRTNRQLIPSIFPSGIDFEQLSADREKIVFNRMSARYTELKNLPAPSKKNPNG